VFSAKPSLFTDGQTNKSGVYVDSFPSDDDFYFQQKNPVFTHVVKLHTNLYALILRENLKTRVKTVVYLRTRKQCIIKAN
jgi:hypothetical protein